VAKTRKGARKTAQKRAGGARHDLKPLKRQIQKNIDKLNKARSRNPKVKKALASMKRAQRDLTAACLPVMVLDF
jgi:multidrug resistance efflux pump